jgi:hypothetical protein
MCNAGYTGKICEMKYLTVINIVGDVLMDVLEMADATMMEHVNVNICGVV